MVSRFLLYGANGYTGNLIARFAVQQGLHPILAGRNFDKLKQQATELDLEFRSFRLEDTAAVETALAEVPVVLNCAGPFSHTAQPMIEGCLHTKTHYLDIAGEPVVLEAIAAQNELAKTVGIMLLPAVGFDLVPSDCLAAYLKAQLPSATHLTLGVDFLRNRLSRGTMNTMVESQPRGGLVRHNGILTPIPTAWKTRQIDFGEGPILSVTVPLGDPVTAFYSTGIPNIEIYASVSAPMYLLMLMSRYLKGLLSLPIMQDFQKRLIQMQPLGPTEAEQSQEKTAFWGEVTDEVGNRAEAWLYCPSGYKLTALAALTIVQKVLAGQFLTGFQTPSRVYGADLILEIAGVTRQDGPSYK